MTRTSTFAAVAAAGLGLALATAAAPTASSPLDGNRTASPTSKGPTSWTRLSTDRVTPGTVPSLYRTGDGVLHVAYAEGRGEGTSLGWSNVSARGNLLAQGTIASGCGSYDDHPRLIPAPNDRLRVVFISADGTGPCDNDLRLQAATAARDGTDWTLAPFALNSWPVYQPAAVAIPHQAPIVAGAWNEDIYWRQADGSTPSTTPDNGVHIGGCCAYDVALARDSADGRVILGWHRVDDANGNSIGTFVQQLRPTVGPKVRVPSNSSSPFQPVALTGRRGAPAVYAAYCVGEPCHHINLWRIGAERAITVPRSGNARHVAIAPAPRGRLWIVWQGPSGLQATLTNPMATRFGAVRLVKMPDQVYPNRISAHAGTRRQVDVVVNTDGELYHRQLLPGLTVTAKPRRIDNDQRHVVTFTVTDAGASVPGVTVRVAGKSRITSANGTARIAFHKGIRPGRYPATAVKPSYAKDRVMIRVLN